MYVSKPKTAPKNGGPHLSDSDAKIREIASDAIKQCRARQLDYKKRLQIAEEMTQLLSQRVTATMLNDWTAPAKKGARFPAAFIEAFCEVVGDDSLQRKVMGARLRNLVKLAEAELEARRLSRELLRRQSRKLEKKRRRRK